MTGCVLKSSELNIKIFKEDMQKTGLKVNFGVKVRALPPTHRKF